MLCLSHLAWVLWYLGYPEQGLLRGHEAMVLAQEVEHPYSLAMARIYLAVLHYLRREDARVQQLTEAALALANAHDYPHWRMMSHVLHGWALIMLGQPEAGLTELQEGLAARKAVGTSTSPFSYFLLDEVYAAVGQAEAGLGALAETQAMVQHLNEHWVEPEFTASRENC
ncbi:MAG: hypothetical protein HYZ81_26675 [Nitrospinae bacterium]|nr:hypothetical protein [Nitrospinota bacterium]